MNENKKIKPVLTGTVRSVPLLLCLLSTALLFQDADSARRMLIPDDAVPDPLFNYVHPAAAVFLGAGYLLAAAVLALSLLHSKKD